MDPITFVVAAVAAGAAAGLKDTAAQAVKDAYQGLKSLLTARGIDVGDVERKPDSPSKRASLQEDLADVAPAPGDVDPSVYDAARRLLEEIRAHEASAAAAAAVGVDLESLEAGGSIRISGVDAAGAGVRGRRWKAADDVVIENVSAGRRTPGPPDPPS